MSLSKETAKSLQVMTITRQSDETQYRSYKRKEHEPEASGNEEVREGVDEGEEEIKSRRKRKVMTTHFGSISTCGSHTTLSSEHAIFNLECDETIRDTPTSIDTNSNKELINDCYDSDTLKYLLSREHASLSDPQYLSKYHPNIDWTMRLTLLDWMMEVAMDFRLKRETFHLSINYVDRYLSRTRDMERSVLQLLGASALWTASKIEEIYPPKITDFAKATDNCYTIEEIKEMERITLLVTIIKTCIGA